MKKFFLKSIFCGILGLCFSVNTCIGNENLIKRNENSSEFRKISNLFCGNLEDFISKKVQDNTVLLFEENSYHHECIPGYAKYFLSLGYNVDVLLQNVGVDSFSCFDKTDKLKIYSYSDTEDAIKQKSELKKCIKKYKLIFLNTLGHTDALTNCLDIVNMPNTIMVVHSAGILDQQRFKDWKKNKKIVTLGDFSFGTYVNPHYFGKIDKSKKNKKTNFVVVGNTDSWCRDYRNLFKAVEKLSKESLDFKITVFGRRQNLKVPDKIKKYFDLKGRLSYEELYNEIKNADFILMLLNPKKHSFYKTSQVSGNVQLAYGFKKPVIINKDFADFYHFNSKNSIIEEKGNLAKSMKEAIKCSQDEYAKLQENLNKTSNEIFKTSLKNLRGVINEVFKEYLHKVHKIIEK